MTKKERKLDVITGQLKVLTRLPSSVNGNPRFLVSLDDVVCKTIVDSSLGYSIQNMDGKRCTGHVGKYYGSMHIFVAYKAEV